MVIKSSTFIKQLTQWSVPTLMETLAKATVMAIAAYILPKSDFGVLTLATLMYSFHPFLQFGIVDGLIIKLSGYYVQGDISRICSSLGLSLSYILLLIAVASILGVSLGLAFDQNSKTIIVCAVYFSAAFPYQIFNHYLLLNRYTYNFLTTFKARSLNAGFRIFFQVPLLYGYGIFGLVVGEVLIFALSSFLIVRSSNIQLSLNFNLQRLRFYLEFGVPIWFLSLLGMLTVSAERTLSAYIFDLKVIADVGLLGFLGSLLLIFSGQILSLFSQYSREFLVKVGCETSVLKAYFIFAILYIFFFVVSASLFYQIMTSFIFPVYFIQYIDTVPLLLLVFAIFQLRVTLSFLASGLLIIGDRKNLLLGNLIFITSFSFISLIYSTCFDFTLTSLLLSVLTACYLQFLFLLFMCASIAGSFVISSWLLVAVTALCMSTMYCFYHDLGDWIALCTINLLLVGAIGFIFSASKQSRQGLILFKKIIQKDY